MSTEIRYLTYVTVLTALLWIPYVLNMIRVRGLADAVGYPVNPRPLARWAARLRSAHYNAIENLAVFAALVLVAHTAGISTPATEMSSVVYFWARLAHPLAYVLAIPWVRTLAFVAGFAAQLCIARAILQA
jgi:uncharacterized MAPEG superfamily protein